MSSNTPSNLYSQSFGTTPSSTPFISTRDPGPTDTRGPNGPFKLGQRWINSTQNSSYTLTSFSTAAGVITANWLGEGGGGDGIQTINTIFPDGGGNFDIVAGSGVTITPGTNEITIGLTGGSTAIDSVEVLIGGGPIVPNGSGQIAINGLLYGAGPNPVATYYGGPNNVVVGVQTSQAIASSTQENVGLCAFNSSQFAVDANGFVSLLGGGQAVDSFTLQAGTTPCVPNSSGLITLSGAAVAAGSTPIQTNGTAANTATIQVQRSQAIASTNASNVGLCAFNSSQFGVDANGFVTLSGSSGSAIKSVNVQTFTASGTYTPSSGMVQCQVQILGGGGAGGGAATTSNNEYSEGSGGGSGEYAVGIFTAIQIGASQVVTIGAGGTGVAGGTGNTGGTTSLGVLMTALGGVGGTTAPASGAGTALGGLGGSGGTGGSYRCPGQAGGEAQFFEQSSLGYAGAGGNSQLGAGGRIPIAIGTGNPGLGYGAGGSGSGNTANQPATAGGAGASGVVIVTEYIA